MPRELRLGPIPRRRSGSGSGSGSGFFEAKAKAYSMDGALEYFSRHLHQDPLPVVMLDRCLNNNLNKLLYLYKSMETLIAAGRNNSKIVTYYCNSQQVSDCWQQLLTQQDMNAAAQAFYLLQKLNNENIITLNTSSTSISNADINLMHRQALLAQRYGAPGYILAATICYCGAGYIRIQKNNPKTIIENGQYIAEEGYKEVVTFYQLAVQYIYTASLLKDLHHEAMEKAALSPHKIKIVRDNDFFDLFSAVKLGNIIEIIAYIQKQAGVYYLDQKAIQTAANAAKIEYDGTYHNQPFAPVLKTGYSFLPF